MTIVPTYFINTYGLLGQPVNALIDYLKTPAGTTNIKLDPIPTPTLLINQNNQD